MFVPSVLLASAIVLVPGLALSHALRLRGLLMWGFAPAAGVAIIAVSAVALGLAGVGWSLWTALGAMAFLTLLAAIAGRLILPQPVSYRRGPVPFFVWAAIALGAVLGAVRMATVIGHPGNLSQTNDATFHLNALQYIADSGSASSLDVLGVLGSNGFYPAAWHAVTSLLIDTAGIGEAMAANAVSLVIAGPIWTLSITAFVWFTTGGRRLATVAAALMASSLYAFPFDMLDFGVLYPYALSVALLPGVLAVLIAPLNGSQGDAPRTSWRTWVWISLVTLVGLAAIGLAQPAVLLVWVLGAVSLLLWYTLRQWTGASRARRRGLIAISVGIILAAATVWLGVTSISSEQLWAPRKPAYLAAIDLLLNDGAGAGPVITMSILALLGFVAAIRVPSLRWLVLYAVAVAIMTLAALSVQNPILRGLLAAWYADSHRFVALMPLVVIPLASIGCEAAVEWVGRHSRTAARWVAVALITMVLAETAVWTYVGTAEGRSSYEESETSYLSVDERAMLEALPEYVDAGDRVLGNPSAGAAYGYALSGLDVVPRTWSKPGGGDFEVLQEGLVDLSDNRDVCPAVERMGIDYVLDFGDSASGAGKWEMPGLTGFAGVEGFDLVASRGDASLWKITGCD